MNRRKLLLRIKSNVMKTILNKYTSNLSVIVFVLAIASATALKAQCHIDDFNALRAFALSTNANSWTDNTGWDLVLNNMTPPGGCDLSTMVGVTINGSRVTHLQILENNLTGMLPTEIGDLTELTVLDLSDSLNAPGNNISGSIPSSIGQLSDLQQLRLNGNNLSGKIPVQIGDLSQLISIAINNNNLDSNIPSTIGNLSAIQSINLSQNNLTGDIPTTIGNLTQLRSLVVNNNSLNSLPTTIGNCLELIHLVISNNEFNVELPAALANCSLLSILQANNYSSLGPRPLPDVITDLTGIRIMVLGFNDFTGTLPVDMANLAALERLFLNDNNLTGNMPPINDYPDLNLLYLHDNNFTGGLPTNMNNLQQLTTIVINNNPNLGGVLPLSMEHLTSMQLFQAINCGLTGSIPPGLANWTDVWQINLAGNQLSGDIPDIFSNLNALSIFNVNDNQLTGQIPASLGDQPDVNANFINNNMSGCFDINLMNLCDTPGIILTTGNMFDTTWAAFCDLGLGVCAQGNSDYCEFNNGLPTILDVDGNACVQGVINVGEALELTPAASPPSDPAIGTMYFDANSSKLRVWDGFVWQDCW